MSNLISPGQNIGNDNDLAIAQFFNSRSNITDEELDLLRSALTKDYTATTRDRLNRNLVRFFVWVGHGPDGWAEMIDERRGNRAGRSDPRKAWGSDQLVELSRQFLGMGRLKAIAQAAQYREFLKSQEYAPATINTYLWAVREMISQARKLEVIDWSLKDVEGVQAETLRDTRGTDIEGIQRMIAVPDQETLLGKRNHCLLLLLFQNALRREEVAQCNVSHFDPTAKTLSIKGKGKRSRDSIDLSDSVVSAISNWLEARDSAGMNEPLFIALDRASYGHRLTGTSIYKTVRKIAKTAGVSDRFSPHKIRHSAITAVLDATDGDLRTAQGLSRHKTLDILQVYDDNRKQLQGKATGLLESQLEA